MTLAFTVETLDGLPEGVAGLYTEASNGTGFQLNVDGLPGDPSDGLKSALDKERSARREADRTVAQLNKQFEGLDAEAARDALLKINELESQDLLGEGKFDEAVAKRTERMKAEYESQVGELTGKVKGLTGQLEEVLIDNAIRTAATESGVLSSAVEDAILAGQRVFKLVDGKPTPVNADGQVVFGKDGSSPMSITEWIGERKSDKPHWYGDSSGGGASDSAGAENGAVTITREQAKDVALYRAAKEKAAEQGVPFRVTD